MIEGAFEGTEERIFFRSWEPMGEPKRIVQIVHGYAEHGGRYAHVAEALIRDGAVVYADDHTGHGRSGGERAVIKDFDHAVADLHALTEIALEDHPGRPVVLVGHSMGGLLSGRYAQKWPEQIAGVAFCGAVIGDWQWARDVLADPELPYVAFDADAISRDPEAGAAYAADPLVYHGQYKRALLIAEVEALDAFAADIDRLTAPVLVLHGTADPFVPYQRSVEAARDLSSVDVTVRLYEDGRHEVLNEINRDEVIGDLASWIGRVA